jgi:formylglycine-generating enzyme required for sulfatase activity
MSVKSWWWSRRVSLGGSWGRPPRAAWISYRGYFGHGSSDSFLGVRLVRRCT